MKLLQRLFRSPISNTASARSVGPQRSRLSLEGLETRLAPANLFVVPISQVADGTHVHSLAYAIQLAGSGGTVTVEPGDSPDLNQPIAVTSDSLLIQGDPNVPASILPSYKLQITASHVRLLSLNLDSVTLGSLPLGTTQIYNDNTVTKCLINTLTEYGYNSRFTQNTILGHAVFQNNNLAGYDTISNNTFASEYGVLLTLESCMGEVVTQNTFTSSKFGADGIFVDNCGGTFSTDQTLIADNTITMTDVQTSGIYINQSNQQASYVRVLDNNLNTNSGGTGLRMSMAQGHNFFALVQGNDFHSNLPGITLSGDSTGYAGDVDMGGGVLSSLGGNNFRGYTQPATPIFAAMALYNVQSGFVSATHNLFASGVTPSSVIYLQNSTLPNLTPLTAQEAFVQALYHDTLGRTGAVSELDGWVNVLNAQGQAAVANALVHSGEALGGVVDQLYLRFLGRQSDAGGRAGWIGFLQNGGTLEGLETAFLTSPEYLGHINTDFVQSLYLNILGRTGSAAEVAAWNNQIQQLGLHGIADAFTHSSENRMNTLRTDFQNFLHRTPTNGELASLANSPQDLLALEGVVFSSPEFFAKG